LTRVFIPNLLFFLFCFPFIFFSDGLCSTIHHSQNLKLDEDNFVLWRHQVLATIRGLKLLKFLQGDQVPSSSPSSSPSQPLEEVLQYQQQDQLIIVWFLASMTTSILTKVMGLDSSAQIWKCLQEQFASHMCAQIHKMKLLLKTPKNDKTIYVYLHDIKKVVNMLAAIGSPITTEDHIESILEGLPEEYNAFIVVVTSHTNPYSINEIESLLLAQEERFQRYKLAHSSFQANATFVHSQYHQIPSFRPSFNQYSRGGRFSYKPSSRYSRSNGPRPFHRDSWTTSPSGSWKSNRVRCQLCSKFGHHALQCWHWTSKPSSSKVIANTSQFSTLSLDDGEPSILGTPSIIEDPLWYPDSGASHHITHDSTLFTDNQEYQGFANVKLGNGTGMSISYIGSASCVSLVTNTVLSLQNLLHVPTLNKNLLSVSKFAKDNNVFFEF